MLHTTGIASQSSLMPEEKDDTVEQVTEKPAPLALVMFAGRLLRFIVTFPLLLIFLLIEKFIASKTNIVLPPTSGPYSVGRRCCHWIDFSRQEQFSSEPDDKRELIVWFWYPALKTSDNNRAPYLPLSWAKRMRELGDALPGNSIVCNAVDDAPVIEPQNHCPLLVFAPGLQQLPTNYSALFEELASNGYVVAGICGPYTPPVVQFPDGNEILGNELGQCGFRDEDELTERKHKLLSVWLDDMRFVIDKISNLKNGGGTKTELDVVDVPEHAAMLKLCESIDMNKIGAFGHSFGGTTALQLSIVDERCKAAICMDGWFEAVDSSTERIVPRPFLYFAEFHEFGPGLPQTVREHRGHFAQGWVLRAKGFVHSSFSDGPLFISSLMRKLTGLFIGITGSGYNPLGSVPGNRVLEITRLSVLSFFDQYLKQESTFFQSGQSPFPETTLERLPD